MERKQWTKEEIEFLKINFSNKFNYELSKLLNRSESSITKMSHKLKLKKSKEHKSKCISIRNKKVGRDINYELMKNESKKYKTRKEFSIKDPSLYGAINRSGFGDEMFSHMTKLSFSIPQMILFELVKEFITNDILYNTRKIIKPYELDVYLPRYKIAFDYDGKGWHNQNKNDDIKNNLCRKNKIHLFRIIENNRNYEIDIKNQFIDCIEKINKLTNIKINKNKVINFKLPENFYKTIYDKNDLLMIAKKYTSFKEFINKEQRIYKKLIRLKLIDEATIHMLDRRKKRNLNEVKEKIDKYIYYKDFVKYEGATYSYLKKNKLEYMLHPLTRIR